MILTNNTNLLTEAGFEVLHNELRYIYYKGSIIDLLGLENSGDCSGLISEDNKDHYKIALVHQPDYFTQIKESSVQLQLSGHTLGGYYKLPFIGSIETKEKGKKYVSGKHVNNGTTLLISNGFHKESNDQHRFLTYDEINIIKLKNRTRYEFYFFIIVPTPFLVKISINKLCSNLPSKI